MARTASWVMNIRERSSHSAPGSTVTEPATGSPCFPSGSCGHCAGCGGGNPVMCRDAPRRDVRLQRVRERARRPGRQAARYIVRSPMARWSRPLAVSLYGVGQSGIRAGDTVLVLGGGTVALYAIYWARRLGARRIVAMSAIRAAARSLSGDGGRTRSFPMVTRRSARSSRRSAAHPTSSTNASAARAC